MTTPQKPFDKVPLWALFERDGVMYTKRSFRTGTMLYAPYKIVYFRKTDLVQLADGGAT